MKVFPSPKPSQPLIVEVMGFPDTGKAHLHSKLAARFGGMPVRFPHINVGSPTGDALLKVLQNVRTFEALHADWWALVSAANFTEIAGTFDKPAPVFFALNYKTAFRTLFGALGVDRPSRLVQHLPEPSLVFALEGGPFRFPSNFFVDHSLPVLEKWKSRIRSTSDKRVVHIDLEDHASKYAHVVLNSVLDSVSQTVRSKYGLEFNQAEYFTHGLFYKNRFKNVY